MYIYIAVFSKLYIQYSTDFKATTSGSTRKRIQVGEINIAISPWGIISRITGIQ